MIWSFQRGSEQTRCEIRRESEGEAYEFVVTRADGAVEVERFDDPGALITRSATYFEDLRQHGWVPIPATQSPF